MKALVVSVTKAKAVFSVLLKRAAAGHEVIITRHGKPIARVLPVDLAPINREPGILGWKPGSYDPAVFAPMTNEEAAAEGWP